jgi:peptide/histidine transporter 3/4
MSLASIAMFIAGVVETFRQDDCDDGNSGLSIFYQLPQYIVMGLSEVFGMVASFEFAYLAAPESAQSLIMSLRFCSLGLTSFIGEAYVKIFTESDEKFEFEVSI